MAAVDPFQNVVKLEVDTWKQTNRDPNTTDM